MSPIMSDDSSSRPLPVLERIDKICDAFEAAWPAPGRMAARPQIEDYLGDSLGPERSALLTELLALELEYRREDGDTPAPEDYLGRFPEYSNIVDHVFTSATGLPTPAQSLAAEPKPDKRDSLKTVALATPVHFPTPPGPIPTPADAGARQVPGPEIPRRRRRGSDRVMSRDERVIDLVLRADELHAQGQCVTPEELCANCPELLEPLRQALQAARWMDELPEKSTPKEGPITVPAKSQTERPSPSADIAGYELLEVLGQGGMGIVYKARQVRLNRLVALKMIRAGEHATRRELARFRTEAQAVAQIQHPNIVQIYEVGEHDGLPFFSLEYVDGCSLAKQFGAMPQPPLQAARLVETLARAIHAAHQKGIIHRDLKPSNVLVAADGTLKVTDFGLAKRLDGDSGQTRTGVVMGTPSYMAPEQALGKTKEIGPAVDIYALGAVLYEALSGRPPFRGTTIWETLDQVRTQDPVPPGRLQPKVPRDLETICLKCLHKEPARRYATALDLARDLQCFLEGRPIQARPVSAWGRAYRWARRRPAQAGLVAAIGLAVLAGTTGAVFYALYKDQQAAGFQRQIEWRDHIDALRLRGQQAEDKGQLPDAKEFLDQAWAAIQSDPTAVPDEVRGQIAEARDRVHRRLRAEADRQKLLAQRKELEQKVAGFRKHRDEVLFRAIPVRQEDAAVNAAHVRKEGPAALEALGLAVDAGPEQVIAGLRPYGEALERHELARLAAGCFQVLVFWAEAEAAPVPGGAPGMARPRWQRALRLLNAAAAVAEECQLPISQELHVRRAACLAELGDQDGARRERQRAARQKQRTGLDQFLAARNAYDHHDFAGAEAACAKVLQQDSEHFLAQYLQALCLVKRRQWEAAKVALANCLRRQPGFLWARMLRAVAHGQLAEIAEAEADFAQALAQAADQHQRWSVLTTRGAMRVHWQRGDDADKEIAAIGAMLQAAWVRCQYWENGVADLHRAIAIQPREPEAYVNLAQAYRSRQQLDAAKKALDQVLKLRRKDPGFYHMRAMLHLQRKDWPAARRDFENAIFLEPKGSNGERLASDYVGLGHLQDQAGEYQAGLASFAEALRIRPDYAPAYRQRAETLYKLKRYAEAGRALDMYLGNRGTPTPAIYLARGLIHMQLREYANAVGAFSQSLVLRADKEALSYRGWAYLRLGAVRQALADFDAALERDATDADALCGRGHALLRLGQVTDGVADVEKALHHGRRKASLLYSAACFYAQAAGQTRAQAHNRLNRDNADSYEGKCIQLIRAALEQVPDGEGKAFWRANIENERELLPVRDAPEMIALARQYGG
jgi:tetratricopeptide (TPR) repeat protein/tRNA A-37 threonylcarbamoyl transferase component Bud32